MSFKIYYTHSLHTKLPSIKRDGITFLKINKTNFKEHQPLIQHSIDLFNSEITWEEMWDVEDANIRTHQNQILYLLLENDIPLGHVWYESYYLYNAFVSAKRQDGDSIWFMQETMWDMAQSNNLNKIQLYVDSWNTKAIKFWEKLGFVTN